MYSIYTANGWTEPSDLDLQTEKISAIPIINRYLKRMGIEDLISGRIDGGGQVTHSKCLMILLRNIILEREPVYGIGKRSHVMRSGE